jgi:hypothetical protein
MIKNNRSNAIFSWWVIWGQRKKLDIFSYLNNGPARDLAISPLCSATSDLVIKARTNILILILNVDHRNRD